MTARKGWSTGGKVAAWLAGAGVVLYGGHLLLSTPAVEERVDLALIRLIGIHVQRQGEPPPTSPAGMTTEAGRRALVAFHDADTTDRWIRAGFTFWSTPKQADAIEKAVAEHAAAHPRDAQCRAHMLDDLREIQAKLGET